MPSVLGRFTHRASHTFPCRWGAHTTPKPSNRHPKVDTKMHKIWLSRGSHQWSASWARPGARAERFTSLYHSDLKLRKYGGLRGGGLTTSFQLSFIELIARDVMRGSLDGCKPTYQRIGPTTLLW